MQQQERQNNIFFNTLKYQLENRVGNDVYLTWIANLEKVAEARLQTSVQILVIWVTVNLINFCQTCL